MVSNLWNDVLEKDKDRESLNNKVNEFLKSGGKIQIIETNNVKDLVKLSEKMRNQLLSIKRGK